nr:site-specific integrase [Paraburkholderia sp. BL10I2N1]
MGESAAKTAAVWIMLSAIVRINELCAAPWSNVDLRAGTWFIPADQSKNRRSHTVWLSDFTQACLAELHAMTGHTPWLLPANRERPITTSVLQSAFSYRQSAAKEWGKKNAIAEITGSSLLLDGGSWSAHDLRRTGATFMQVCGVPQPIIEACLNHALSSEAREKKVNLALPLTYQQYDYARERRDAWQRLGQYLENLAAEPADGPDIEELLLDAAL